MQFESELNREILGKIEALKDKKEGTDEYKSAVDSVTKLMDRAIEIQKLDNDVKAREAENKLKEAIENRKLEEQIQAREAENKLKHEQLRDDKLDKLARNVLTGFTFGGTMFTIWCLASATFTFEEKGTITSSLGRKVLGMLVPKF